MTTSVSVSETTATLDDLVELDLQNPALARLQKEMAVTGPTEQVITSYDRMHHRHSRS